MLGRACWRSGRLSRAGACALLAWAGPALRAQAPRDGATAADAALARRIATAQAAAGRGLAWLAAQQQPSGCWLGDVGQKGSYDYVVTTTAAEQRASGSGHVGVTAIAGLAFLAGGHLPGRGEHGAVLRKAIDYVVAHVAENGFISDSGTNMYSHAFATLFLAEVHGLLPEPRVKEALERAVLLIVDAQNRYGAWRYHAFTQDADLSVTVCQLQALRAARNIGIRVPRTTIDRAVEYVEGARVPRGYDQDLFTYKQHGRSRFQKNREYAINAAALTSLFTAGVREPKYYEPVLDFLDEEYPHLVRAYSDHYFFWYGSFYASQAYFQAGDQRFRGYWQRISDDLLRLQDEDGRWIDRIGPGDAFSTAVACVVLAIPLQYLPIFQR
jgi:hypothetical protein